MLLLIAERLREIRAHQRCFQGEDAGAYLDLCVIVYSTYLCLENKAAPAKASKWPNIDFGFRPDDNGRLIVHECSGLEPGDVQGLRAIMNFIANRTDSGRPASERLHAVW